jgi:hypothetical protein
VATHRCATRPPRPWVMPSERPTVLSWRLTARRLRSCERVFRAWDSHFMLRCWLTPWPARTSSAGEIFSPWASVATSSARPRVCVAADHHATVGHPVGLPGVAPPLSSICATAGSASLDWRSAVRSARNTGPLVRRERPKWVAPFRLSGAPFRSEPSKWVHLAEVGGTSQGGGRHRPPNLGSRFSMRAITAST